MGIFSGKKKNKQATGPVGPMPMQGIPQPAGSFPGGASAASPSLWDGSKCWVQLKMAKSRIDIHRGKKDNEIAAIRRTIAEQLKEKKEPLARIQCERVLRERSQIIAFDILETYIDIIVKYNETFKTTRDFNVLPQNLRIAVASLVFAHPRVNVPELEPVVTMIRMNFGGHAIDPIVAVTGPDVMLIDKLLANQLSGQPPDGCLILKELQQIAHENSLDWQPPPEESDLHTFDFTSGYEHNFTNNNDNNNENNNFFPPPGGNVYNPSMQSQQQAPYNPSAPDPSAFASVAMPPMNIPGLQHPLPPGQQGNVPSFPPMGPSAPPPFPGGGGGFASFGGPPGAPPSGYPPPPPPPGQSGTGNYSSHYTDKELEDKLNKFSRQ